MTNTDWEVIKEFYKENFGFDGWLVEMYANLDILALCVAGASNESITKFLELPINEVIKAINDALEFDGWKKDLPVNPYRMYTAFSGIIGSVEHFKTFVSDVNVELAKYPDIDSEVRAEKLFYLCEKYHDIDERIQNEWI